MINLGGGASAPTAGAGADDVVIDVTDATFIQDIVEQSKTRPVIVDFWAPWCGPCRQLTPALEEAVRAQNGKVVLAKVDVDQNPAYAGQLRVQSIPSVFAFVGGQPIDGFQGALAPGQIKKFVEGVVQAAGGDAEPSIDDVLAAAEQALADGAVPEAMQAYGAVLQLEPTELRAIAGVARCYLAGGDVERARAILDTAPADKQTDPAIAAARAAIELAEETAGAQAALAGARAKLDANPDDHQARYDVAMALLGSGDREGAVNELLDIFRRDRSWNDEAAKTQLMKLFDAFGPTDPVTLSGRRKLSSMIFA